MKKLLVTAIGAAAAFGAVAGTISTQRFENVSGELPQPAQISSLNELAGGNFWSGDELTNTYTYISCAGEAFPQDKPLGPATKALEIKTTFGSPLTVKAIAGDSTSTNIPASGIYFDSLVKFTVCEEEPEQTYDGAKIIMWLQEAYASDGETITGTNIMVRANYINADGTFTPTNFVCKPFSLDIDAWHRVTIKTWANIVNGYDIPGFVIFINESAVNVQSGGTMASAIAANLTEAAYADGELGASKVFASLVQGNAAGKSTITSASFDGTGKLTDLVFTDKAPFEAAEDYVAPEVAVTINGSSVEGIKTLAQAVAAVNDAEAGQVAMLSLKKGMTLDGTLAFASDANVVLDFAGCVLTNESDSAAAISNAGMLTITNSTVAVGGVYCADAGAAVSEEDSARSLLIAGGNFWGNIAADLGGETITISGGAFAQEGLDIVDLGATIVPGKKVSDTKNADGLYEVVDIVYYTITFNANDGAGTMADMTVEDGVATNLTANAFTRAGYTFEGWSTDAMGEIMYADGASITPGDDITLYAKWSVNTFTIKFAYGAGLVNTGTVANVAYNTTPSADSAWEADITGMAFTGWSPTIVAATADAVYTAQYSAKTYTVTFYTNSVAYTTANYTYGDASTYTEPAAPSVDGYTFGGWYTDNGTFESAFTFDANVAGDTQVAYAKLTSSGPAPIDPSSETPQTIVTADSQENAIAAATLATPTGVDAAAYKSNFDFEATSNGDGTYTVTMTGIKESVKTEVSEDAVDSLVAAAQSEATTVSVNVPAGLYYKVTTYDTLGGAAVDTETGLSNGSTTAVDKPASSTQGFIKVEMATKPFNN